MNAQLLAQTSTADTSSLLRDRQIAHERPIAAGWDLYVADRLARDDDIVGVPERERRHLAADEFLRLRVELFSTCAVGGADGFAQNFVEFRIVVAAAVEVAAFQVCEQVTQKDRVLIAADPTTGSQLKLTIHLRLTQSVVFERFD